MTVMSQDRVAEAFRRWGYLHAELDPLGRLIPFPHPDLEESRDADANRWRSVYCGSIGAQFMHMPYPDRCRFIAERMEAEPQAPDRRRILRRIAEIELFERFLHGRYVGTKRYSLEGGATLVTALDAILDGGAEMGAELALIGMSHRGRLSIMTRVVGVQPALIFAGFGDIDPLPRTAAAPRGFERYARPSDRGARGCGVRGAGHCLGDAEPRGLAGVFRRGNRSRHREQSDRLHRRAGAAPLVPLRLGCGASPSNSHPPRERRGP